MIQWHPLFARLLQPVLEEHYDIQTDLPVGDLPRRADIILVRRTSVSTPSYQGMWRHLTTWNVLEFKGRSEPARVRDLDLLMEVGLGIDRRLNEERSRQRQPSLPRPEVSFWYLANHLGRRFLREAHRVLGTMDVVGPGLWRGVFLERPLLLVSNRDVPVDRDSIPVHLVSSEPVANEIAVAELVLAQREWWNIYGPWLVTLHPNLWEEMKRMARKRKKGDIIDWALVFEKVPELKATALKFLREEESLKHLIDEVGPKRLIEEALEQLTPAEREEIKRRFQD